MSINLGSETRRDKKDGIETYFAILLIFRYAPTSSEAYR
jgi:hypothetical protein